MQTYRKPFSRLSGPTPIPVGNPLSAQLHALGDRRLSKIPSVKGGEKEIGQKGS